MKTDSFKELKAGVLLATDTVVKISQGDISSLVETAAANIPRKRAIICTQRNAAAAVHEMMMALDQESYLRPHMHPSKSESLHIIEGLCDVVLFEPDGSIQQVIRLGDYKSGHNFFYRLADPVYHGMVVRSPRLVVHETTNGPFTPEGTVVADWAPDESDVPAVKSFMRDLSGKAEDFLKNRVPSLQPV